MRLCRRLGVRCCRTWLCARVLRYLCCSSLSSILRKYSHRSHDRVCNESDDCYDDESDEESDTDADSESSGDDDADARSHQRVMINVDGVAVECLRVRTGDCTSAMDLCQEICAAAWELTNGAGSDHLKLEYPDQETGCMAAVVHSDRGASFQAARRVPKLFATFRRRVAYNKWHWYRDEAAGLAAEAEIRKINEGVRLQRDADRRDAKRADEEEAIATTHATPESLPPTADGRAGEIERALRCGEMDLWGVLGLSAGAPPDVLRRAYLRAGRAAHPDKNREDAEAATEAQKLINMAYTVRSPCPCSHHVHVHVHGQKLISMAYTLRSPCPCPHQFPHQIPHRRSF